MHLVIYNIFPGSQALTQAHSILRLRLLSLTVISLLLCTQVACTYTVEAGSFLSYTLAYARF